MNNYFFSSKIVQIITSLITASSFIIGIMVYDKTKADTVDVVLLNNRLEYYISCQDVNQLQNRIWVIESRYTDNKPDYIKRDIDTLRIQLEDLKHKRELLRKRSL
jgi:hypothetical protein